MSEEKKKKFYQSPLLEAIPVVDLTFQSEQSEGDNQGTGGKDPWVRKTTVLAKD